MCLLALAFPGNATAFGWTESFDYLPGNLSGQGGWAQTGGAGASTLVPVAGSRVTANLSGSIWNNHQDTVLAGLNLTDSFTVEFDFEATGAQLAGEEIGFILGPQSGSYFQVLVNTGSDFEASGQAIVSFEDGSNFDDSTAVACARNTPHTVRWVHTPSSDQAFLDGAFLVARATSIYAPGSHRAGIQIRTTAATDQDRLLEIRVTQ